MIGTIGAAVLVAVYLLLAGMLGLGAGGFLCFVRRRPWSVKVALVDAMIAVLVALVTTYVLAAMLASHGVWGSTVGPVLALAVASVVVRHLLLMGLRPSH